MGELSLINYVISCSLKWLGQSGDASGHRTSRPSERQRSRAALEDAVGEQKGEKTEDISVWLLNCKATVRAMPRQARNKGARKAWERKDAELPPARTRAGSDGGDQERDSGLTAHPKNCISPPPPKRQTYKKSLFGEKEVWLLNWHRSGSRRADLPEEDVL